MNEAIRTNNILSFNSYRFTYLLSTVLFVLFGAASLTNLAEVLLSGAEANLLTYTLLLFFYVLHECMGVALEARGIQK